jgi:hypothetical protein
MAEWRDSPVYFRNPIDRFPELVEMVLGIALLLNVFLCACIFRTLKLAVRRVCEQKGPNVVEIRLKKGIPMRKVAAKKH